VTIFNKLKILPFCHAFRFGRRLEQVNLISCQVLKQNYAKDDKTLPQEKPKATIEVFYVKYSYFSK
jgi:hypothetical protein